MSSLIMSTSVASITSCCPSTSIVRCPFFSSSDISCWSRLFILAATPFISLPYFFPMVRKLHFTDLTRISSPSTNLISLTLTSFIIRSFTASTCAFWLSDTAGIIICCKGWRTLMFTLRLRARVMEVIFCAIDMRSSRSVSMNASSATGNVSRCTLCNPPSRSW